MDVKTTIEVYSFSFYSPIEMENHSFSSDPDVYEFLKENWVKFIDVSAKDIPTEKRAVRIPPKEGKVTYFGFDDDCRFIYGIIESGLYGKKYDIADKSDPKKNVFTTSKGSAIMKPFFYLIQIPSKGDKGLIVLERTENDGIYGVFSSIMSSIFRSGFDKRVQLKKSSVITHEYLKDLTQGVYKSITMSVKSLPEDIADKYFCKELNSEDFSMEMTIKFNEPRKNQKKIKKLIEGDASIFVSEDVTEILEGSEKKVVTTVGRSTKTRTYHLNNEQEKIRPYYELIVEESENGFSLFSSILSEVKLFLKTNKEFKIFK